tara:strand:- start:748 stop:1053 length:306 start_codon:yes stop_codon:yes gene_type:complete
MNRLSQQQQYDQIDQGADFYMVRGIDWDLGESPHVLETLYLDEALAYFNEGVEKSKRNADPWHHPNIHWELVHCTDWERCPNTGDWVNPTHETIDEWVVGQ